MGVDVSRRGAVVIALLSVTCRYDRSKIPFTDPSPAHSGGSGGSSGSSGSGGSGGVAGEIIDSGADQSAGGSSGSSPDGSPDVTLDPCAANGTPCTDPYACVGEGDAAACQCQPGYLESDAGACLDIDECAAAPSPCPALAFCDNVPGSYNCRCPAYFTTASNGDCIDDRYQWSLVMNSGEVQIVPVGDELLVVLAFAGPQVFAGTGISTAGDTDLLVAKFDAARHLSWKRQFGGPNAETVFAASADSQGDLLVTGYTEGGLDLGSGPIDTGGERKRFVAKFRGTDGMPIWSHDYFNMERLPSEDLPGEVDTFMQGGVIADADGNVVLGARFHDTTVIGTTTLTAAGGWDMFVAKYSPQGATLWARRWGGAGNEYVRSLAPGVNGDIYLAATFDQALTFGSDDLATRGDRDVLIGKLDANGQPIWSRQQGGTGLDTTTRMGADRAGNPVDSGQFIGTGNLGMGNVTAAGEWDAWVTKWNADGTPLWSHPIGGAGTDLSWGVTAGPQGETIVAGFFNDTVDFGEGPRTSAGWADAFITKYAADGSFVWSQQFGGPGFDNASYVRTDDAGRVYAMGWFSDSITLGGTWYPNSGMYILQLAP